MKWYNVVMVMNEIQYVKRYQMIFDFAKREIIPSFLPAGFFVVPWHYSLVNDHARILCKSFQNEIDALIFPTFTRFGSCLRLIRQCTSSVDFIPQATLLIARQLEQGKTEYCAAIQTVRTERHVGMIQNVSVIDSCRRLGLGRALVSHSLEACRSLNYQKVSLEVTVANFPAIKLYQSIGFELFRTTYKETCFL